MRERKEILFVGGWSVCHSYGTCRHTTGLLSDAVSFPFLSVIVKVRSVFGTGTQGRSQGKNGSFVRVKKGHKAIHS